jgi:fructose-specific phosphotransferase system IIA component
VLLSELLTADRVRIPLAARTKDAVLEELVQVLSDAGAVDDAELVLAAVRQREAQLSTGVGGGVGIPHGKAEGIDTLAVAAGVSAHPVDFEALDGKPVELFFLLVGPDAVTGSHVQALASISRLLRREGMRERLCAAASPEEFLAAVLDAELGAEAA